ncbi:DUF3618 domain-containing protein [uncultured Marinobacter sp.]|uniref:DUF3618 domain-containing protein n=1 Tax=uncultured Marinobacter sp. TaxID=187379 RepID=UPI0026182FC2|nr:DUF3618 domain-containing protein [uncultured Marinobacter sp.]
MTNESRSPEEIEREIERERAGLTGALDDLQNKFSIESIARQVSDQFREHGGDIGRSVSEAVKSNPVALALTGVGLAWLIMGDRSGGRDRYDHNRSYGRPDFNYNDEGPGIRTRRSNVDSSASGNLSGARSNAVGEARSARSPVTDKAKGAARAVSDKAQSAADSAHNLASSATDRAATWREQLTEGTENFTEEARNRVIAARESAIDARDAAASYARQGRERAVDMFEEQPLVAGALAVAVGAALGAALPRSRMEDQYLGEHSDKLFDDAERIFEEEKQKLGRVAKAATDEAKKAVSESREKADDAAPADTAGQAVADEAKSYGKRIVDAAESEAEKQNVGDIKKS